MMTLITHMHWDVVINENLTVYPLITEGPMFTFLTEDKSTCARNGDAF